MSGGSLLPGTAPFVSARSRQRGCKDSGQHADFRTLMWGTIFFPLPANTYQYLNILLGPAKIWEERTFLQERPWASVQCLLGLCLMKYSLVPKHLLYPQRVSQCWPGASRAGRAGCPRHPAPVRSAAGEGPRLALAAHPGCTLQGPELFTAAVLQQGSWGRMLGRPLLFCAHIHTHPHTTAASLFNEWRTLFWHNFCVVGLLFFFPKEVTGAGGKRAQLWPQLIHISSESLEASPQIVITSSWIHRGWQHG